MSSTPEAFSGPTGSTGTVGATEEADKVLESATKPDAPDLLTKYATIAEAETFSARAWHGFLAGITSTAAVKAEKSIAVTVLTRIVIAVGGGVEAVKFVRPAVAYLFRTVGLG